MNWFWKILGVTIGKGSRLSLGVFSGNRRSIVLGEKVGIGMGFQIICSNNAMITIGKGTRINRFFTAGAIRDISIGEDCLLSYNINIHSGSHSFGKDLIPGAGPDFGDPIVIGDRCFIGCGATILGGVTLGENCVVGAGSVVTKSFPKGSVIGGNPARIISTL